MVQSGTRAAVQYSLSVHQLFSKGWDFSRNLKCSPHDKKEELHSYNSAIFVSLSSLGEILALSGINEARASASELPEGPAEDSENDF